nr:MAG TPA: hypothetical protein [Caudoviricetes sp.]
MKKLLLTGFERLRMWRYRKFIKTLPKAMQEPESLIDDICVRDLGRRLNPFSRSERDAVWTGIRIAQVKAFDKVFPE